MSQGADGAGLSAVGVIKCRDWERAQLKPESHEAYLGKWALGGLGPRGFTVVLDEQVFKVVLGPRRQGQSLGPLFGSLLTLLLQFLLTM